MKNIQKLLFSINNRTEYKKKINVYIANMDFLKQKMNLVYIARQEKMEDQNAKNVNIYLKIQMKLDAKNVKKIVLKLQMENVLIVKMK